jgi:hypothetical protein
LFPRHLPIVTRCCLHHSSLLSPSCPIILPPHHPSSSATTTHEPPHKAGAGSFVIDHPACLSCSPLVSSELLLMAELGLGRLVSPTIVSSLESKK